MAGQGKGRSWSHSVPATPKIPESPSLQHLPPGLRQLQGQRATKGKGSRGKEDGGSLGDSHKGREDADPQHGSQLTQGVQEAEGCGPVQGSPRAARDGPDQEGDRERGREGWWGQSRYEEVKERWRAMSKRERKDRGQRGEGRTAGNIGKLGGKG